MPIAAQNLCIGEQKDERFDIIKCLWTELHQSLGADSEEQGKGKIW